MTDKYIIKLNCDNCPEKARCKEQQEHKNNIIDLLLEKIRRAANSYHCNIDDYINRLRQNLPNITRCDVVLEKQLQRKEQECEELKEDYKRVLKTNHSLAEEHKTIGKDLYSEIKSYREIEKRYKQALEKIEKYTITQFCDNCEDIGSTEYSCHCEYCEYQEYFDILNEVKDEHK